MNTKTTTLILTIALGAAACELSPEPLADELAAVTNLVGNDELAGATAFALPASINQHIFASTTNPSDPSLPCLVSATNPNPDNYTNSVWFRHTAAGAYQLAIDTGGTQFDSVLAVFTGTPGALDLVACNDDIDFAAGDLDAMVTLSTTPGETYYVMAASYGDKPLLDSEDLLKLHATNAPNNAALALFDGAGVTLLDSLADDPGGTSSTLAPPVNNNNMWIMGDWNGDGVHSPGVFSQGAFFYTDGIGPDTGWVGGLWLGLAASPSHRLVSGRFDPGFDNDCIGVVDGNIYPATGDLRFSLKYWCDMQTPPQGEGGGPLMKQFLGSPLGDSQGFIGTHQFTAGDWDGDGMDEIAVRRGEFITYTLVEPVGGTATFGQAQYWGTPCGQGMDSGVFVGGDWNGDGVDGWGVMYCSSDEFFYRSNLGWNPGDYSRQSIPGAPDGCQVASHMNASGGDEPPSSTCQ